MDAVSDPSNDQVIVMTASQCGKTEILLNTLGYFIQHEPSPILVVQPTLDMAGAFSKDRVTPMLRDTPILNDLVRDPRSRDSGNTIMHKEFSGGHLTMCGSNSPSSLASRPIRIVLVDECDRFPMSSGAEGDPVSLARKRSATFYNRKFVMTSTPTVKGASRIEASYNLSDQRKYHVPCPDCETYQELKWSNVKWEKGQPETAVYVCSHCEYEWTDADRLRSIRKGKWVASKKFNGIAGFHLSGLYSGWTSLKDGAIEFYQARKLPETLRVFTNTYLAESWEDAGEQVDNMNLYDRREKYETGTGNIPSGVAVIVAGVDVQDNRIEMEILGVGRNEETWSLEYNVIYGDPTSPNIWTQLDTLLNKTFKLDSGVELRISSACIDSGAHTQNVYQFCKPRFAKRIFAIKGIAGTGKPILGRPTKNNIAKIPLFPIGVDTTKELIYSRLKIQDEGSGYCHFPVEYDQEYFLQLTAEKIVTRYHKGFAKREWIKIRPRNEALDCRVYAIASFTALNTDINKLADRLDMRSTTFSKEEQGKQLTKKRLRPNFANSWRK